MRSTPPAHHRRPNAEAMTLRKLSTISEDTLTPINEPFQYDDADLMLVSSDGLGFRVHGNKLGRCSNIFRTSLQPNALPTPPSSPNSTSASNHDIPEIHFIDPTLENGITLSLFLHLAYSLPLPVPTVPIYFQAYETLVEFLRKWECTVLYPVLSGAVRSWVEDGMISSSKGLKIGDALGSERLLVESVKRGGEYTWAGKVIEDPDRRRRKSSPNYEGRQSKGYGSPPGKTENKFDILRDGLPGEASLDLTAVPFEYFVGLSDDVKFALLRASRAGVKERHEIDWDRVGDEFERVLAELRTLDQ
ncbi:hypothetical protein I302_104853 [Kwoniella bestiolae CBS 10118]|uniref:BTB domain-containing protein n=1 Tax=Kwoniella bestiolae CBS 10118 TaxID=1296100 RepID=A0A1B9FRK3_9TREE|nr:hypothetical protein I302_09077 [Kwoniella bestiolae CBS 10118]OCF21400.1 hypothetical protein I302_09077 [Kwoniella bestiolae CBS 10118]